MTPNVLGNFERGDILASNTTQKCTQFTTTLSKISIKTPSMNIAQWNGMVRSKINKVHKEKNLKIMA